MTTKQGKLKLKVVEKHSNTDTPSILTTTRTAEVEDTPSLPVVQQDASEVDRELANRADVAANERKGVTR